MPYPTEPSTDERSPAPGGHGPATPDEPAMAAAVRSLRALIMAGERYRLTVAGLLGLGTTETQALSYLAVHGARGQSELARDLSLTSSAATALVDRLERHGAAERARHPTDRRRTTIRLTPRGEQLVADGQRPLFASLNEVDPAALPLVADWLEVIAGALHARPS
jgi:DNA-binding MarR family transcriptional regulator